MLVWGKNHLKFQTTFQFGEIKYQTASFPIAAFGQKKKDFKELPCIPSEAEQLERSPIIE